MWTWPRRYFVGTDSHLFARLVEGSVKGNQNDEEKQIACSFFFQYNFLFPFFLSLL